MEALTSEQARRWCSQGFGLRITSENLLRYKTRGRYGFMVRLPVEFRRLAVLSYDLLSFTGGHEFEGGLLWLHRWEVGVNRIIKVGWKTLEEFRRAHGSAQSLEVAPAQGFRSDEFVDMQAFLLYTMAYEWSAYLLPRNGDFFLDIRGSGRLFCTAKSVDVREKLFEHLKIWNPTEEDSY